MEEQSKQAKAAGFQTERKQRSNSAYTYAMVDGKHVWTFPNLLQVEKKDAEGKGTGEFVRVDGKVVYDPATGSATNRERFRAFGEKQRIQDGGAIEAGPDGKVDVMTKYTEMTRVAEHYATGTEEWTLRPQAGSTGPASYVTQALVSLKTFSGAAAAKPGKVDVSDAEKANAFVKQVAENPALKLKGEMGKARAWLEANSKSIREAIVAIRAAEAPAFDADAEIEELAKSEGEYKPGDQDKINADPAWVVPPKG